MEKLNQASVGGGLNQGGAGKLKVSRCASPLAARAWCFLGIERVSQDAFILSPWRFH